MVIKKLQNNYTTQEQSKRLLELGLPADSADCYARIDSCSFYPSFLPTAKSSILCKNDVLYTDFCASLERCGMSCIPIWSVGRLIEIFTICAEYYTGDNSLVFNKGSVLLGNINCLISVIELAVKDKCIDFSKLEE